MNQFDFLSVLVSIIIALGLSHLLSSTAQLIRRRGRVAMHYTTLVWMAVLFLLQIQVWWVAFYRRELTHWSFFGFLLYLLIPILISVLGYLLVSEIELELEPEFNLEREYYHNRRWFFGILGSVVIVSLVEDAVRSGTLKWDLNSAFRFGFLLLCAAGFGIQAKRMQFGIALTFIAALLCYIGLFFARL